ncbi:MAG: hypothetical protein H0Z39_03015 [Peptococcaceae bacterium]|nr:hypothetical protein [Peptococcaceae bacterium]
MGKRIWLVSLFTGIFLLCLLPFGGSAEAGDIKIVINGDTVSFSKPPEVINGTTMLPMRECFNTLGAAVAYDGQWKMVVGSKKTKPDKADYLTIALAIDCGQAAVMHLGGSDESIRWVSLREPPRLINGSTYVPLRVISEALGGRVTYEPATKTVFIDVAKGYPQEYPYVHHSLTEALKEKLVTANYIIREYKWNYGRSEWAWTAYINKDHYDYFRNLKRPLTDDYSVYVTNQLDDSYIASLVKRFKEAADKHNFSERELVDFVVSFVQSLAYVPDDVSVGYDEYPKYPLETLVDRGGDCEDTSILLASILHEMGYGVVLLALPDHMAVGVKGAEDIPGTYWNYQGARYYYVETTGTGWQIGEIPEEYRNQKARILPLVPHPVITHSWTAEAAGNKLQLKVKVSNEGTAAAYNTKVYAAFDAGSGKVYDQTFSAPFDLAAQSHWEGALFLNYPYNARTRIIVKIISNGVLMDESYSEWVDT